MCTWQKSRTCTNGPHFVWCATIKTNFLLQNSRSHICFDSIFESVRNRILINFFKYFFERNSFIFVQIFEFFGGNDIGKIRNYFVIFVIKFGFSKTIKCVQNFTRNQIFSHLYEFRILFCKRKFHFWKFIDFLIFSHKIALCMAEFDDDFVSEFKRANHKIVVHFVPLTFHHRNRLGRSRNRQIEM